MALGFLRFGGESTLPPAAATAHRWAACFAHIKGEFIKSSRSYLASAPASTIAITGFVYFIIAVVALYFLNPSYTLANSMAGNYDLGSYEFLIASTFFALGVGSLALMFGLLQVMLLTVRSGIGLFLLGIWGVGIFLAGIFPANEPGSTVTHMTTVLIAGIFPVEVEAHPETAFGFMHIFAILGSFLSLTFAVMLLASSFKRDERWRHFHSLSFILALVMLAALVSSIPMLFSQLMVLMSLYNIFFNPMFFALTGITVGIVWLVLAAIRLRYVAMDSVSSRIKGG